MSKQLQINKQIGLLISALGLAAVGYLASQYFFGNSSSSSDTNDNSSGKNTQESKEENDPSNFVETMKKQVQKYIPLPLQSKFLSDHLSNC